MEFIDELLATLPPKKKPKAAYKKPQSIKDFEKEYLEWSYKDKDLPYRVPTKFRDDKANELTKLIVAWCKVNGFFATRINTQGTYDAKRKIYRKTTARKGMADVTAVINGRHFSFEVKVGKDKIRPEQLKVQQEINNSGGFYAFIHCFDEFIQVVNNQMNREKEH